MDEQAQQKTAVETYGERIVDDDDGGGFRPCPRGGASNAAEKDLDRAWYDDDEGGGGHGDAFNPFIGADDDAKVKQKEEAYRRLTRRDGKPMTLAQSKKMAGIHADHNAWEENRMLNSGVVVERRWTWTLRRRRRTG